MQSLHNFYLSKDLCAAVFVVWKIVHVFYRYKVTNGNILGFHHGSVCTLSNYADDFVALFNLRPGIIFAFLQFIHYKYNNNYCQVFALNEIIDKISAKIIDFRKTHQKMLII